MAIYSLAAIGGTGIGPVAAGWVEMNTRLQWTWIQWIHMMFVIVLGFLWPQTDQPFQHHWVCIDLSYHFHEGDAVDNHFNSASKKNTQSDR